MFVEHQVAAFMASFARTASWAYAAPVLGDSIVPRRVRVVLAGGLALTLTPLRTDVAFADLSGILPFEVALGVMIGAVARFILASAESGGQLIGIQMGLGFAGAFDPIAQESSLPTRRLAFALAALAFIGVGGFDEAIRALTLRVDFSAFSLAPVVALIEIGSNVFTAAVRLAAPLLLAGFVANLTMALVSKAAPALNVFSVMLALFIAVGLFILVATAPAYVRETLAIAEHARDAVWGARP